MTEDLLNIASQLSKPEGEAGIQMGEMMNATNIAMTTDCINQLNLKDFDSVLELGHGNCRHLKYFLSKANNISYTGLEISSLMSEEAKKINQQLLHEDVKFLLYEGMNLPFEASQFDAVITVNTIYFWKQPLEFLKQIYHVLNAKGKLLITMADKSFMRNLPFTKYVFTLYEIDEVQKLAEEAGFKLTEIKESTDEVRSKAGDLVTRKFYTLTLSKI